MTQTFQARVQETYASLTEFKGHDRVFDIAHKCGFENATAMWLANPLMWESKDFGLVDETEKGELN